MSKLEDYKIAKTLYLKLENDFKNQKKSGFDLCFDLLMIDDKNVIPGADILIRVFKLSYEFKNFLKKSLNKNVETILRTCVEIAKEDLEKARKSAVAEAEEVLKITEN